MQFFKLDVCCDSLVGREINLMDHDQRLKNLSRIENNQNALQILRVSIVL